MNDKLDEFNTDAGCPSCGSKIISKVKFTWWGGVLGPRLLHHTKCETCNYRFNSKTGKSNTQGIIIYSVLIFVMLFVIVYVINSM